MLQNMDMGNVVRSDMLTKMDWSNAVCCLGSPEFLKINLYQSLELTAVVLSMKVACLLRKESQIDGLKERLWPDSQVVLAYIRGNYKWFKMFVANHIQGIGQKVKTDDVFSKLGN